MSTCWSELKKLAKILVGSDPSLFPSLEDHAWAFKDQPTSGIRIIATRLEKTRAKAKSDKVFHDPNHIHNSVIPRLAQFAFLNNPLMATISIYTSPLLWQPNRCTGQTLGPPHPRNALQKLLWRRQMAEISQPPRGRRIWVDLFSPGHNGHICHNSCK